MKPAFGIALLALAVAAYATAAVRPDHQIVGTWTHTLRNECTELYTFRADGTNSVTSGEEISTGSYTISDQPNERGVYTMVDTIASNNGKPDCMGGTTPIGDVATVYVKFSTTGNGVLVCYDLTMRSCYSMKRVRDI